MPETSTRGREMPEEFVRTRKFQIRMRDDELEQIREAARATKRPAAEMCRGIILDAVQRRLRSRAGVEL